MACLFCLKETDDSLSLHGASESAEYARNIIAKHFWFVVSRYHMLDCWNSLSEQFILQVKEIDSADRYACLSCWSKVESFHEFYAMVASNYQNSRNADDVMVTINPLLNCEPGTVANEAMIKVEIDQFDSCASNYEAIYIPSTFVWDDSNKQINEETLQTQKQNNNPVKVLSENQESVEGLKPKKVEESEPKNCSTSVSKKKRTIKTKPHSREWKPKQRQRDAIITIDGVM